MEVITSWTTEARDVWEQGRRSPFSRPPPPVLRTACGSAVAITIPSGMAVSRRPSFSAGVDPRLHLEATFRFQRQDAFNYIKIEPLTLSKMTLLSFRLKCQNYTTLSVKKTI